MQYEDCKCCSYLAEQINAVHICKMHTKFHGTYVPPIEKGL